MTIHFQCENCKHPIIAPEEMFGRRAVCPQCKSTLRVPEPGESSAEEFHIVRDGWKVEDRQASSMPSSKLVPTGDQESGRDIPPVEFKSSADSQNTIADPIRGQAFVNRLESGPSLSTSVMDKVAISTGNQVTVPAPVGTNAQSTHSPDALWYVRPTSGGQFGPASMTLLRQWKTEGRVTGESWVWQQGWDDWQRATVVFSDLDAPAPELIVDPNTRSPTIKPFSKTDYMKARRRRSVLVTIGLSLGTIIFASLLLAVFYFLRNQGGG